MKVAIKKFHVAMDIKKKGTELDVSEPSGGHFGDLVVTQTKLIWCPGKTRPGKGGIAIKWKDFATMMANRKKRKH